MALEVSANKSSGQHFTMQVSGQENCTQKIELHPV